jgi:hypothetical protein
VVSSADADHATPSSGRAAPAKFYLREFPQALADVAAIGLLQQRALSPDEAFTLIRTEAVERRS